jgi:TonB-linked SusC/RagA family outer membrane protein
MRNGGIQNYNVSASGSSDKANFYASVGIMDEKGLQIHNDFTRYNARFNFDYKVRNNVTVGVRFDGNWSKYLYPHNEIGFSDTRSNQIQYAIAGITPYDPETGRYGGTMAYGEDNAANLLAYYDNMQYHIDRQEANSSFYGIWEIFKGLTARVDYALNYYNQFSWVAFTPYSLYNFQTDELRTTEVADNAAVENTTNTGYKTLLNGQLNYHKLIAGHHDLSLMFAYSEEYWYARSQFASRNDRLHPSLHEIDAALTTTQSNGGNSYAEGLRSYISRINYVAYDKYLLEVNFRSDGSSKFAEGHRWGFFPSAALGWRFSEENFMKGFTGSWLTGGKLRVSYGTLGNNSGVGRYEQKYTLATANYMINGSSVKGFTNQKLVNAALSWETTAVTNTGLDISFLNGRLGAELDYYDRLTTGMIQSSDMSFMISGAYTSAPRTNVGNLRNRGVEANITWRDNVGNLNYSVGVNASYNRTNLEKWNQYLGRGTVFLNMPYNFVYSYEDIGLAQSWQDVYNNGINNSSAPGDVVYLDLNGDGILSAEDRKAYPNVQYDRPTTNFALNGYLEWKGIDFTFLFQGATGRKDFWLNVYNNLSPGPRYAANEGHWDNPWSWDNRDSSWPRLGGNNNSLESTYWLDNLTYLRLKNLQLGYNLPQKWMRKIKIDRFRIYGTAENLLTLTHNYRGLDPEITGNRNAAYPLVKSYSIGINIGF